MNYIRTAILTAFLIATFTACGSKKEATGTKPTGNKPSAPATQYGDVCTKAGLNGLVFTEPGSGYCNGLAGYGGCLDPADYFEDPESGDVYDVWYCENEGDSITFCACGSDLFCNDTGSAILCEE